MQNYYFLKHTHYILVIMFCFTTFIFTIHFLRTISRLPFTFIIVDRITIMLKKNLNFDFLNIQCSRFLLSLIFSLFCSVLPQMVQLISLRPLTSPVMSSQLSHICIRFSTFLTVEYWFSLTMYRHVLYQISFTFEIFITKVTFKCIMYFLMSTQIIRKRERSYYWFTSMHQ